MYICEDSSGTGENDDLSMISLIAQLMSFVLSRAALSKCSSLLGNTSFSVLRLQSGCALTVLATSVLKFSVLVDVPAEDSMDGRSSSESSSKTLDIRKVVPLFQVEKVALFIRFTCTCSTMSASLFSSLERVDSGFDSMNLSKVA